MAHQVQWQQVCVTDDEGVDHYVHRGANLPGWVPEFTLFALTTAGALQVVDGPASKTDEKAAEPEETSTETDTSDELVKPSPDDTKAAWVDYAADSRNPNRITRDQANGMTKSALMERFK